MEKIKNSIKIGNFFEKLFCLFLIKIGFSNSRIQTLEIRNKKYNYIKKKYNKVISNSDYKYCEKKEKNNNIWICWLQGYDSMPDIVKKCVDSICKFNSKKNIIFIDANNYSEYIQLPEYIIEKWKKGIISHAHFTDVIRTELLVRHGGLWIDATTLLLDKIPDYVYNSNLFMFNMTGEDNIMTYNNWFIYSEVDNRILKSVRDLLYEFWKRENKVQEYFIWHIFMKMVYDKYPSDFKDMMYIPHAITHMINAKINDKFDINFINEIRKICPIQKLTYKITNPLDESYFNFIAKEEI